MARSGRLCLNLMEFPLTHSQSDASFLKISFSFKGLTLTETKILSSWPFDPGVPPRTISSSPIIVRAFTAEFPLQDQRQK
ncbi:hypothetical protein FH972_013908 [Carpinus fangiana]|uniref:Uncharacterized protein n=1 Tax=Carpinus fangiana TaxID=176857 RepID=A0A5N6R857_9ROSI|nr:hypothetical protein FH972_013908 [Carpinus fangiana]